MADDQEISDEEVDVEAGQDETNEDEKDKKTQDIRNPDVVTKYRLAADIANQALDAVVKASVPGTLVVDLCALGDKYITDHTDTIYRSNKITKGIGFPTCVSVNHIVGSYSPPKTDDLKLAEGDVVKVDLGVHIDGYVSQVAHTFVVTGTFPVTGRKADVVLAAYTAAECAVRLLKPGTKNTELTAIFEKIAADFKVKTVEGVLSHQVERFVIDAEKVVANNNPEVPLSGDNKIKETEFEANEAWALDIVMSTGSGKPTVMDNRTTVYKRNVETSYSLKMKAPRAVLSEINQKFPHFPFTTRALEFDEKKLNFGVSNCAKHDLLEAYPVLNEKPGEFVAHVKFTALLLPSGTLKITGGPWDQSKYQSEFKAKDESVVKVLSMPLPKKKKKNKNKKKDKAKPAAAAAGAPAAAAAAAPATATNSSA